MSSGHTNLYFVVPPGVHLLDLTGAAHLFYEAAEFGASLKLIYINATGGAEIESTAGLSLGKLESFRQYSATESDIIFVPGLQSDLLLSEDFTEEVSPFCEWLFAQYQAGSTICSVCTGAFLLGQAGLLDGRRCTTHWKFLTTLSDKFPAATVMDNCLFTEQDRVYTSAGVASGIDLALFVIEKKFGSRLAAKVAREVVIYHRRGQEDPQLSIFLQYRNHMDNRVHRVQEYLMQHLQTRCALEDLAEVAATSPRNLTRLFRQATGITVGQYHERLRAELALKLEQEGHTRESIAEACGLASTNQVRHLLKKYGGQKQT